jgi:hypothetical protein
MMDVHALDDSASGQYKCAKTMAPLTASIRLPDPTMHLECTHTRKHLVTDPLHPPFLVLFDHGSHHKDGGGARRHLGRDQHQHHDGILTIWLSRR